MNKKKQSRKLRRKSQTTDDGLEKEKLRLWASIVAFATHVVRLFL